MKKIITSLCLGFMLIVMAVSSSKASVFYVLDGDSFTLTPVIPGGTVLSQFLWTLEGTATETITTAGGIYTHIFHNTSGSAAQSYKLSFGVVDQVTSCVSSILDHTIIVLPKLTVAITTPDGKENFCDQLAFATQLTASVTVTGLGAFDVTLSPFAWKKGTVDVTGTDTGTSSVLDVNAAGTYSAIVSYVLPTTGNFIPTATKILNAITGATKTINNNLPLPVVPTLTLN
ncbi:hypothetical protein [Dyadobacter frigoris]|uniref:Uncharacterized protein n=1 Tax=Dyadobacter frigoris TaxID=2576211 RepID=A0A4U6D6G2_9BACT|nr:hypothetical protein [Dyadobacter frigoris]TKT91817.1 hypothetical protein FDK13_11715 [Dyadobacter frigoris]GLU53323.1 hypothetical protein Dfri01_27840 [Dyadobacter frigoris]